jgi:hypothetical protein
MRELSGVLFYQQRDGFTGVRSKGQNQIARETPAPQRADLAFRSNAPIS